MSTQLQARGLRVTVIAPESYASLERSYGRGLEALGCDVNYFDLASTVSGYARMPPIGRLVHRYFPVESWVRKGNRELALHVVQERRDLVLVVGTAPIRVGTLAQIKQNRPQTQLALMWPDPLVTMDSYVVEALKMYDVVAACSRQSIPVFERLGARRVAFTPFAADYEVHPLDVVLTADERARYTCDVIFIGGHRPERERAILALVDAGIDVKVWGPPSSWRLNAEQPDRLEHYFQNEALHGRDFAKATRCARVAINIMDPGNYPGCNMRIFENCTTGTATINSPCPELEGIIVHEESTLYCEPHELVDAVRRLLADAPLRKRLADNALALLNEGHTYRERAATILESLGVEL